MGVLGNDRIAFITPGAGPAAHMLAFMQPGTQVVSYCGNQSDPPSPEPFRRVVLNVPTHRASTFERAFAEAEEPIAPWTFRDLRQGFRTLSTRDETAFRNSYVQIGEAAVEFLSPGGQLVLLGGFELGEYSIVADSLAALGLVPSLVGPDQVDTVAKPVLFKYEPGKWGDGQGPWAPYGCLWPSPRLVSVWRKP